MTEISTPVPNVILAHVSPQSQNTSMDFDDSREKQAPRKGKEPPELDGNPKTGRVYTELELQSRIQQALQEHGNTIATPGSMVAAEALRQTEGRLRDQLNDLKELRKEQQTLLVKLNTELDQAEDEQGPHRIELADSEDTESRPASKLLLEKESLELQLATQEKEVAFLEFQVEDLKLRLDKEVQDHVRHMATAKEDYHALKRKYQKKVKELQRQGKGSRSKSISSKDKKFLMTQIAALASKARDDSAQQKGEIERLTSELDKMTSKVKSRQSETADTLAEERRVLLVRQLDELRGLVRQRDDEIETLKGMLSKTAEEEGNKVEKEATILRQSKILLERQNSELLDDLKSRESQIQQLQADLARLCTLQSSTGAGVARAEPNKGEDRSLGWAPMKLEKDVLLEGGSGGDRLVGGEKDSTMERHKADLTLVMRPEDEAKTELQEVSPTAKPEKGTTTAGKSKKFDMDIVHLGNAMDKVPSERRQEGMEQTMMLALQGEKEELLKKVQSLTSQLERERRERDSRIKQLEHDRALLQAREVSRSKGQNGLGISARPARVAAGRAGARSRYKPGQIKAKKQPTALPVVEEAGLGERLEV